MKKNLLLAVALLSFAGVSAQTVVWPCTGTTEDKKTATSINIAPVVTGSTTITAENPAVGEGIKDPSTTMTVQGTIKDAAGSQMEYPEAGVGIVKWVPAASNSDESVKAAKTIEDAAAGGWYVDFKVSEGDVSKYLNIGSVTFNAWRYGTDAVRINAKLIGAGDDGDYESDLLINEETYKAFAYSETCWEAVTGEDGNIPGYKPCREDGSKENVDPITASKVALSAPADCPKNLYEATLRIYIYGIKDNKAAGLYNVTLNLDGTNGINSVAAEANVNAPIFNLAGQQVSKAYKGVVIQNGQKFIQK